jgi:hypothetical protein
VKAGRQPTRLGDFRSAELDGRVKVAGPDFNDRVLAHLLKVPPADGCVESIRPTTAITGR